MAYKVTKRGTYRRSLSAVAASYLERAGVETYLKFIDSAQQSVEFISSTPYACVVKYKLLGRSFRSWRVKGFPVSVFFTIREDAVLLEGVFAHRMNIEGRIKDDLK